MSIFFKPELLSWIVWAIKTNQSQRISRNNVQIHFTAGRSVIDGSEIAEMNRPVPTFFWQNVQAIVDKEYAEYIGPARAEHGVCVLKLTTKGMEFKG